MSMTTYGFGLLRRPLNCPMLSNRISVVTATFNAPAFLQRAIESLVAQDNPYWEMIISPDDGQDYTFLERVDPRIRVVRTTESRSGAGAARNRGLAAATGSHVATLDDDDILAPDFVGKVLKALSQSSCVTVPTRYTTESGELVRTIGYGSSVLDIPAFSRELGSMHVIGRRDRHRQWQSCFAQDVLHTCESIDLNGGAIPVVRGTSYLCTIRRQSTCAVRRDIDEEYRWHVERRHDSLSAKGGEQTRQLFEYRRKINALFEMQMDPDMGYHKFVGGLSRGLVLAGMPSKTRYAYPHDVLHHQPISVSQPRQAAAAVGERI
jgi:glycosyltransferase involved in cell wall biosynthesis